MTYGMTFVFCAGEVDLSVGMVLNVTMALMALLMTKAGVNPWIAVIIGLLAATALGALNGILAVTFRLSTIVVTLGTVSVYRGLSLLLNGGKTISGLPGGSFLTMARIRVFGISMIAWISLVVFGILLFLFKNTRFVRHLILMGDNESAAGKMGIRTRMLRIQVMALSGFLSGLGRGFTAIIVAWLSKFNTFIMVAVSFGIVFMNQGAVQIATQYGLNENASNVLLGIILFFLIGAEFFINYRVKRAKK